MTGREDRRAAVLAAIDAANARDPRRTPDGRPLESAYADALTAWVLRLKPDATDNLRIAARGQHIERWTSPREKYPPDRGGYLRWREDLKNFHASRVAELMRGAGYEPEAVDRTIALITKAAHRAGDPEGVALEDALCLVFLETQWADIQAKWPVEKWQAVLAKTWRKMSAAGRSAAKTLPLPEAVRSTLP